MQETIDHLKATKRILERKGWIQERPHITGGGYCVLGALRKSAGFDPAGGGYDEFVTGSTEDWLERARQITTSTYILTATIRKQEPTEWTPEDPLLALLKWNDKPTRTKEEVFGILDLAIENRERMQEYNATTQ